MSGRKTRDRGSSRISSGRVSRARLIAYEVLQDVDEKDAYANLALSAKLSRSNLEARDAGLVVELTAGTLRQRGRYDRIIGIAANRSTAEIDSQSLNVLRLGAHQLLGMRIPPHAAINETVELQKRVANPRAVGFVNGVLRAISRRTGKEWDSLLERNATDPDDALSATTSHPGWIIRAFRAALDAEGRTEELEQLLISDNEAPKVSLVALPESGLQASAVASGSEGALVKRGVSPLGLELSSGDPSTAISQLSVPAGTVRVQDQGSQLVALALTRVGNGNAAPEQDTQPGQRWIDLCAGPGGKTAVLASEAGRARASLRANEISPHRAQLVAEATVHYRNSVHVVSHDGRTDEAFGGQNARFDRVLVDAPCSGIGALRRRPEARWRKAPTDLPELTELQTALLDQAVQHLAEGGVVAYVTCSPHLAETRAVVDRVLRDRADLQELNAKDVLRSLSPQELDLGDGQTMSAQLWPHRHGTDAMFLSLIRRIPKKP